MSRNWDKLRRQDNARKPPSESQQRQLSRKFRTSRKIRHSRPAGLSSIRPPKPIPADIELLVKIESIPPCYARWKRTRGKWRCTEADPALEWMLRVNHPRVIDVWLRKNNLTRTWLPSHRACTANPVPQAEDNPAEAYPPNQASVSPENNTVASLNNATPAGQRDDQPARPQGLEQNGMSNPRCLIRGGVPTTA